ncbi:MAG TPA: porin family protein [Cytophagales bacterium]
MKKLFLLAALAVCSCNVFAQVSLVLKAGGTFARAAVEKANPLTPETTPVLGFTGGLGVNFGLTKDNFLSIQPEILYVQKGFLAKGKEVVDFDIGYRFNYLEVPLLLKVNFGGEKMKFYVNAGPSIGYLLNGRTTGRTNSKSILTSIEDYDVPIKFMDRPVGYDVRGLYANRIEAGLNLGGGVGYAFAGSTVLFVDVRYNMGLTDFNKQEQSKNRVFALTTGVQIPLSK